jgi:hypothetical protein
MSGYPINLSNGTLVTTVNPGTFNTTTFNVALLGRGVANYGEITAENFVHMLENFAASLPPGSNPNLSGAPTTGQLWYDSSAKLLKVYDTTTNPQWRSLLVVTEQDSLEVPDGTESDPGLTFEGDASTGFYLLNPTGIGVSVGGNNILNFTTQGIGFPDGSQSDPSIYFKADTDTGIYRSGANQVSITTNGTEKLRVNATGVVSLVPVTVNAGTVSVPAVSFASDSDTGIYSPGAGQVGLTSDGTARFVVNTTGGIFFGAFTLGMGSTLQATYADLAERYHADEYMPYGTVVCLGGKNEITKSRKEYDTEVFGVIAEAPAFGMNQSAGNDETHPYVALAGRVRVKAIGPVTKGQRMVTAEEPGTAQAAPSWVTDWRMVIGRALENKKDSGIGYVEIAVGAR